MSPSLAVPPLLYSTQSMDSTVLCSLVTCCLPVSFRRQPEQAQTAGRWVSHWCRLHQWKPSRCKHSHVVQLCHLSVHQSCPLLFLRGTRHATTSLPFKDPWPTLSTTSGSWSGKTRVLALSCCATQWREIRCACFRWRLQAVPVYLKL